MYDKEKPDFSGVSRSIDSAVKVVKMSDPMKIADLSVNRRQIVQAGCYKKVTTNYVYCIGHHAAMALGIIASASALHAMQYTGPLLLHKPSIFVQTAP